MSGCGVSLEILVAFLFLNNHKKTYSEVKE
jgi:hypothetical protein